MSFQFSEQEIKALFCDFQSTRKYAEKIHFFDLHFNVVPFDLPEFDTDIYKFFSAASIFKLTEILRVEQKNLSLLGRVFHFNDTAYRFSISPTNSNHIILNDYIVSKFLIKNDQLDTLVIGRRKGHRNGAKSIEEQFQESTQMISYIRKRIDAEYEGKASIETKLMTVFMKGYADYINEVRRPIFKKRRKFIELYLYAYGYLYGKYITLLHQHSETNESHSVEAKGRQNLDKKINLLKELGLVDGIKRKYRSLNREELKVKAAEIVGLITGEESKRLVEKIDLLFTQ